MELASSAYLYNLSVVAITYAAVSALVMLLRQTMGGKLSNFDIYLIGAFVSFGFSIALAAMLPGLIVTSDAARAFVWPLASSAAALLLAANLLFVVRGRRRASESRLSHFVFVSFLIHGLVVVLLVVNALAPPVQGLTLFATALTVSLANVMLSFVRRITSLLGDTRREDWDPRRG